jgi:hypothetical protein
VFDTELRDGRGLLGVHHRAGRVVRITEDERVGIGRPCIGHRLRRQEKVVVGAGRDGQWLAAREPDPRFVGDVRRLVDSDGIAVFEKGSQRKVDGLARTGGDEDLRLWIVLLIPPLDVLGDGLSEFEFAAIGGVGGFAGLQRVDGGGAGRPRRGEIRLADAQRDHVVALLGKFEELSNS